MICAAPVYGYAIWRVENLSRFSFCLDTHRFRQLSAISGASRNSASNNFRLAGLAVIRECLQSVLTSLLLTRVTPIQNCCALSSRTIARKYLILVPTMSRELRLFCVAIATSGPWFVRVEI